MNKGLSPEFLDLYRQPVAAADDLNSDLVRDLYCWWRGSMPRLRSWAEFDIIDHPQMAANLFLYKILSPGKYEYRLNGENVVTLIGSSQSGRIFSDCDGRLENTILSEYLNKVVAERRSWTCGGTLAHLGRQHVGFESIDCPLADGTGRITHILGMMVSLQDRGGPG